MHTRQHLADLGAVRGRGCQLAFAAQFVHHASRFTLQAVQNVAHRIGCRVGHRNAFGGQVLHQMQVVRQLLKTQALKHREHVLTDVGRREIVGVFNAARAAFQLRQLTKPQLAQQFASLKSRNFGVNGHVGEKKA